MACQPNVDGGAHRVDLHHGRGLDHHLDGDVVRLPVNNPPATPTAYYWCTGFLVTGLTLVCIGLALGRIGHAAKRADLPPNQIPVMALPEVAAPAPVATVLNAAAGPRVMAPSA